MLMSEISRFLMVSNGNVTGLSIAWYPTDTSCGRSATATAAPRSSASPAKAARLFAEMAAAHEAGSIELLGGISVRDAEQIRPN